MNIDAHSPPITWSDFVANSGRSYRRILLDARLAANLKKDTGIAIDLGGKTIGRHGLFDPDLLPSLRWINVNIDRSCRPQIVADVCKVPLRSALAQVVICTETLEHLQDPSACIKEAKRLLTPGGKLIVSTPFLFPVHADPFDYQRFTAEGLRFLLRDFSDITILPMGGILGVLGLFLDLYAPALTTRLFRGLVRRLGRFLCRLDIRSAVRPDKIRFTTGYFCIACKPLNNNHGIK